MAFLLNNKTYRMTPKTNQTKKTITFFTSFEEMENDQLKYFASLSPEELLRNNKKISMGAFGIKEDKDTNKIDRKIKYKKEE